VATKRKILVPARNRTLGLQPVATHYADWETDHSLNLYT
jgi:hypothetical protein